MPSLNASLAWAVPVDIEAVGAHVEAYVKLQPTINALRLCHRFGSGAPISRLPVELVSNIEEFLMEAERKLQHNVWHEDYQCFRQECSQRDHYTEEELNEIKAEIGICPCGCGSPDGELDGEDIEERINERLDDYLINNDMEFDVHYGRMDSWSHRVRLLSDGASVLVRTLGVSVWTSTVRIDGSSISNSYFPSEWTMAYLRLPNAPSVHSDMEASERDFNIEELTIETGCAMDVMEHLSRPKDAEHRFKRAMRILDLKPHELDHRGRKVSRSKEAQHDEGTKAKNFEKSWPRLTMLTNTVA